MKILVIDVGTSSMRGILYRENAEPVMMRQIKYHPCYGSGGEAEQPAQEFQDALKKIISQTAQEETQVEAIAITAQRSSVVPVDQYGTALSNVVMWQDTRNSEICRRLGAHDARVSYLSGAVVNSVFSGSRMRWIKEACPGLYQKAYKLLNIPEYLIHVMTGEFVSDYTYGSRSNLMNIRTKEWDSELLEIFGIERERLCRLVPPGSVVGSLTSSFAGETGMRSGIPVISAGGDQQCAAIGNGACREGAVSVITGTGAFLTAACDSVPDDMDAELIYNCSSVKEKYIVEANVLTCCSAVDWFCRNIYGWEQNDYEKLNRDLEEISGEKTECMILPYFQGKYAQADIPVRAHIANLTLATDRKELLKAMLEGIFLEIDSHIQRMRKYMRIDCAHISGGLTRSDVMNQMQANIYGMPLYRMDDAEATALGALLVALDSLGEVPLEEGTAHIQKMKKIKKYTFDEDIHQQYLETKRSMDRLYQKIYG